MNYNKTLVASCDECKSDFFIDKSQMKNLCPECAHYIYGYENCKHEFIDGHCSKCYWNGNSSTYIDKIKSKN